MLCRLCTLLDFSTSTVLTDPDPPFAWESSPSLVSYYSAPHQPNLPSLFASAEQGCHLCTLIRSELFHIRGHESEKKGHQGPIEVRIYVTDIEAENSHVEGLGGQVGKVREIQFVAKTPMRNVRILLDFMQYEEALASILQEKARNKHPSIGCQENFKLAISWLSRCLKKHSLCTISTFALPPLPTRVLDVDSELCPSRLSLVSTSGRSGRYLTLSHVWGKAQIITTTTATLLNRVKGIAMEDLSTTFRDAVTIAREMNVRYLWIDSMCIIQNDTKDWEQESVKMGSYYSNALFNIAAVSASDGSGGCFSKHNSHETTPCPMTIKVPAQGQNIWTGFLRSITSWDKAIQVSGFQRPPLWQRAWVLQERLLSNRLLMFSDMQMSWKCRQEEASESIPEGSIQLFDITQVERMLQLALMGLKKFRVQNVNLATSSKSATQNLEYGTEEELKAMYDAWYDLVSSYGKCGLTVASDIFPAISGIASFMERATQDLYIAGLWARDLHRGLLWTAPDSTMSKPDLRQYRAPSWSWASLTATCGFYVREILQTNMQISTDMFVIQRMVPQSSHEFPYGRGGFVALEVSGILKPAHPMDTESGLPEEEIFREIPHGSETLFDLGERCALGWYFADNVDRKYLTQIWCCPILTEERDPRSGDILRNGQTTVKEARGLALLRLDDSKQVFMRVGSVWIRDANWLTGSEMQLFSII